MRRGWWAAGAALSLTSAWALAQQGPESLLPPGFEGPQPATAPTAATGGAAAPAPAGENRPAVQRSPQAGESSQRERSSAAPLPTVPTSRIPPIEELRKLSPDELAEVLQLKPKYDIPPSARRAMTQVGVLDENEGGLAATSLAGQDGSLVRAALAGNQGQLVSRWGHVLLRRALASRLDAPTGLDPADFAALRAALLVRMGEGEAARAVVQDVDTGNYTPALTGAAFDAYVATADFTGICPAVILQGGARKDAPWDAARAICSAFQGNGDTALSQLDRMLYYGRMPRIDMLLAQKYAGAAGKARRAVKIEWDGVQELTPWRYGLSIAVGIEPPDPLLRAAGPRYDYMAATAPMLGLARRAEAADRAAAAGILSSAAMVDLYSQIYGNEEVTGPASERAELLRRAYLRSSPSDRLAAMRGLWNGGSGDHARYSRQVLTAYAAARLPPNEDLVADAAPLIASMLTAGLDRNALRWGSLVDTGTEAWALLALAAPARSAPFGAGAIDTFNNADNSDKDRKTAFLVAGLAGLGRLTRATAQDLSNRQRLGLYRASRWSRLIGQAADVNNAALVALLAGVGMQGSDWSKMTPRHLYHIVAALRRVGLDAEARMIAAEAVARG